MAGYFSYPYPVLGNGTDIDSEINDPEIIYDISDETVKLTVSKISTGYQYIDNLVSEEVASWFIRVQCPRTYVRRSFTTQDVNWSHHFVGSDLEGTVNIEVQVVASTEIKNYKPENLHPDYGDVTFLIQPGGILTSSARYSFNVDKKYDPLKAPIGSILKITKGDHQQGEYRAIFEEEHIIVELSEVDWSEYAGIKDRVPSFLHASMVFPVLVEAISIMDNFQSHRWAARLKDIIAHKNLDDDSPFSLAQKLLGFPLQRAFLDINSMLDRG